MKSIGPFLNRDFGGFDRPRALFSGIPVGSDMACDWNVFFDDFHSFTDNEVYEDISDASTAFALDADAENGAMKLSSQATTDDSGVTIQAVNTNFLCKSGRKLVFEARVKVSDADQCDMFVGLADTAATDPEALWAAGLARVGFKVADGSANILCEHDDDTAIVVSQDSGVDIADDTYIKLGFRIEGAYIRYYVNRALVHTAALDADIAAVTLGPSFGGLSGNATGTHTRSIDYFFVCMERA